MYTRTCTWARVWTRVCGWRPRVNGYTHGGRGERRREVRGAEDGRSLFQRTLRSSTLARAGYTVTTMTTMTMVTMTSMTNGVESPLSLSLLSLPSSPLVVDTMVKSRGCSRRFLLSFSVPVRSSFASMRLVGRLSIENHPRSFASFENWRFQFCSVRREIILGGDFFFERERKREGDMIDPGIFRQRVERSFGRSGTSIGAVSVGGAGISRYADDGWI